MEIKASTVYDLEVFQAWHRLNAYGKSPRKKVLKMFILSVALMIGAGLSIIAFDNDILMWIMIFIIFVIVIINCYLYFFAPKIVYKNQSSHGKIENSFIFYDDGFEGFSVRDGITAISKVKYYALFKIIESKKYFFLYENESMAHIIDKTTIECEDIQLLKTKFAEVIPRNQYLIIKDW